jgi:hypothetical protein
MTDSLTWPLPVPVLPETTAIQFSFELAVQVQPSFAVTMTSRLVPDASTLLKARGATV